MSNRDILSKIPEREIRHPGCGRLSVEKLGPGARGRSSARS